MKKRILSLVLAFTMVATSALSSVSVAQAAETNTPYGEVTAEKDGDTVTIGNGAIERKFSTADGKLSTVEIVNHRGDITFTPGEGSEEFIIKLANQPKTYGALDRTNWTATTNSYANETGAADGNAPNLLDGNTASIWHTNYDSKGAGPQNYSETDADGQKFYVLFNLAGKQEFQAFSYTPRSEGATVNGNIKGYELYKTDSETPLAAADAGWELLSKGDFTYDGTNTIYVNFDEKQTATQLKFVPISANNGGNFAGGAEFNLHKDQVVIDTTEEVTDKDFASSELTLKSVDISDTTATINKVDKTGKMVTFTFEPFTFAETEFSITENIVMYEGDHYMRKFMEISISEDDWTDMAIDYIDLESMKVNADDATWTIPTDAGGIVQMEQFKANLGQPIYIQGMFFGSEFPATDTEIVDETGYIRYYTGKNFARLEKDNQLTTDKKYVTWQTVAGAARSTDNQVIQADFFEYIYDIATPSDFRIQYNSWFDNMMLISDETILKSFIEIDKELNKVGTRPLDSYVVDDGWINYNDTSEVDVARAGTGLNKEGFWAFNSKFPEGLKPSSDLVHKFGSNFGVWVGPRGGYNFYGHLANIIEKAGNGSKAGGSIDVADSTYHNKLTEMFVKWQKEYGVNYWKWDGFADEAQYNSFPATDAVPGFVNGHMVGGYHRMYHVTDLWEGWIDIFEAVRASEETDGINKLWLSLTCYVNPSPWFLQWANSVWIQCTADQADAGSSSSKMDRQLTYRDACYYDFLKNHEFQFPLANIYNHDPVYGVEGTRMDINTATDVQFQNYLYAQSARGTSFWELYYSDSIMTEGKYEVTGEFLGWAEENHHMLRNAKMFGEKPNSGTYLSGGSGGTQNAYGFAGFDGYDGIITIRNAAQSAKTVTMTFDRTIGVPEDAGTLKYHIEHSHNLTNGTETTGTFEYGKEYTFTLQADEVRMFRVSQDGDTTAPEMTVAYAEGSDEIIVKFDEKVTGNLFKLSSGSIEKIVQSADDATYHIYLAEAPEDGDVTVTALNIKDMAGNAVVDKEITFTYNTDNKVPVAAGLNSYYGFTVAAEATEATEGVLVNQGDQYALGINAEGKAYFTLGNATAVSDKAVEAGAMIVGVKENNGILKLYVDGTLAGSAYDAANADKMVTAAAITAGANAAGIQVYDIAYGYDKVADLAVEKPEPEPTVKNEKLATDGMEVIVSGIEEGTSLTRTATETSSKDVPALKTAVFDDEDVRTIAANTGNTFWTSYNADDPETEERETIADGGAWLKVDLGDKYTINQVDYTPRYHNAGTNYWQCTGNIQNLVVEVSADGETWKTVTPEGGCDISAHITTTQNFEWFPEEVKFEAVEAQYVRISGTKSYYDANYGLQANGVDAFITVGDLDIYKVVEEGSDPDVPVVPEEPTEVNLALNKTVTAAWTDGDTEHSVTNNAGRPITEAVDGNIPLNETSPNTNYGDFGKDGLDKSAYLQVDLGKVNEITKFNLYRYWDGRTYDGTVIVVSEDETFTVDDAVVYNSDAENAHGFGKGTDELYEETSAGKEILVTDAEGNATTVNARYVRIYMQGSNKGQTNHVVELQVWGYESDEPVVEGDSLNDLIDAIVEVEEDGLDESLYTKESVAAYKAVLAEAYGLIETGATANQISAVLAKLETIDELLVEKPDAVLQSITVATAPKTAYKAGETFDPTGLVLNLIYDDEEANTTVAYGEDTAVNFTFAPTGALTTENTTVTITYAGKEVTLDITVTPPADPTKDNKDIPVDEYTLSAGSTYAGGNAPASDVRYAIDGDESTYWEVQWGEGGRNPENLWYQIDLEEAIELEGLRYLPRWGGDYATQGTANGSITSYRVDVKTTEDEAWTTVSTGSWAADPTVPEEGWKIAEFPAGTTAKYVRLVALGTFADVGLNKEMSAVEIRLKGTVDKTALDAAIKAAEALDAAGYTEESWAAVAAELPEAKAVYGSLTATQDEVDAAKDALNAAVEALETAKPPVAEGTVTRLYGGNRFDTGFAAAEEYKKLLGVETFEAVVVATGYSPADALSGSYLAVQNEAPILLADPNNVDTLVDYVKANLVKGGKVYILGGTGAVPAKVEEELASHTEDICRLKGTDRFGTNLEILAEVNIEGATELLVATGWNYADSLSASAVNKPILLVEKVLTDGQKEVLEALGEGAKIYILGGDAAVSEDIAAELAAYGTVERVKGKDRFGTSVEIAKKFFGEDVEAVTFAYGWNYPDGLCGGPVAAAAGAPVLLVHEGATDAAAEYAAGVEAGYIFGGSGAVADETVKAVLGDQIQITGEKYE